MDDIRLTIFNEEALKKKGRCVIYWMQASQRAHDNYALNTAIRWANKLDVPLVVYFGLWENYPEANERAYLFMLEGLYEVEIELAKQGIPLVMRVENPAQGLPRLCRQPAFRQGEYGDRAGNHKRGGNHHVRPKRENVTCVVEYQSVSCEGRCPKDQ